MTLNEKANKFADDYAEKVRELLIDAYKNGYCEGTCDAVVQQAKNEEEYSGFIDLGLPSGTLWREEFLTDENDDIRRLAYNEARNFSLPTEEQCRELMSKCILVREKHGITFRGKDNEELYLGFTDQAKEPSGKTDACIRFWVKGNVDSDLKALCLQCSILLLPNAAGYHLCRRFVGEKIAVLTVKNKKKRK